jgi:opacity protein-like surface antigen
MYPRLGHPRICSLAGLCLSLLLGSSAPAFSQEYTDALNTGANEYQIWSGYGLPQNPTWFGSQTGQGLSITGFQYGRVLLASNSLAWKYTIDAIPMAFTSTEGEGSICVPIPGTNACTVQGLVVRKTSFGAGVNPVGMQLNFRRRQRLQPMFNGALGFLYFDQPTPVLSVPDFAAGLASTPASSQFNFTFDFGGGVQWFISPNHSLTVGYRFHHLSNHNIADANPGIDSHFLYVGFSFHR